MGGGVHIQVTSSGRGGEIMYSELVFQGYLCTTFKILHANKCDPFLAALQQVLQP